MANTRKKDYNITPTDVRAELPKAVAAMAQGAIDRGWRAVRGGHGNIILVAPSQGPGRRATIELPRGERSVKANVFQSWRRKIEKYGTAPRARKEEDRPVTVALRPVEDVELPTGEPAPPEAVPATGVAPEAAAPEPTPDGDGPVVCPDCGREWPNSRSMGSHRRTHAYAKGTSKSQRQRDALELIVEAAAEALGQRADATALAEELATVTRERDELRARLDRITKALS